MLSPCPREIDDSLPSGGLSRLEDDWIDVLSKLSNKAVEGRKLYVSLLTETLKKMKAFKKEGKTWEARDLNSLLAMKTRPENNTVHEANLDGCIGFSERIEGNLFDSVKEILGENWKEFDFEKGSIQKRLD